MHTHYACRRYVKGISGGETKRVSIGCSLMQRPRCMFLVRPPLRPVPTVLGYPGYSSVYSAG
eukprot:4756715-Pyramimonas_sp.AAC.1